MNERDTPRDDKLNEPARSFAICKDHQDTDWNQPALEDDACILCRLFYLEAQESLLEEWQQRAKRAEDTIAEIERPLDAQMARLNATVERLNGELERCARSAAGDTSELERLREQVADVEEAEARCCPEDVGFEEWIGVLKKHDNVVAWRHLQELVSLILQARSGIPPMRDRSDYPVELQRAIDLLHGRSSQSAKTESVALADISTERQRQIEKEGWTHEHDDGHIDGAMAVAAACYALDAAKQITAEHHTWSDRYAAIAKEVWPWDAEWWKPKDARRDLVRAGALIAAEIEKIDRATNTISKPEGVTP